MLSLDISQIIKERFGRHRGSNLKYNEQNSLKAIKEAVDQSPIFVEFDIVYRDKNVKTCHPPQEPVDPLKDVLKLFRNTKTYPKFDLKLERDSSDFIFIDTVIDLTHQVNIPFALATIGSGIKGGIGRKRLVQAYYYFFDKIKHDPKIKLALSLSKIINPGQDFPDQKGREHLKYLAKKFYCLDAEIHEHNWEITAQIAKEYSIPNIFFWVRSWPSVINPKVHKNTILKALELENQYPVKVYFDINPEYIVYTNN